MSRTLIKVGAVLDATSQINAAKTAVSSAKNSFTQTKNSIDGKIKNRSNINGRLNTVQSQLSNIDSQIGKIRSTVQSGANLYQSADNRVESWGENIKNNVGAQSVRSIISEWASYFKSFNRDIGIKEKKTVSLSESQSSLEEYLAKSKPYAIASLVNAVSPAAGLLYITSGLFVGEKLSIIDPTRTASATADADWLGYEVADDHPGITAWLGKASAQAQNEWAYAGVNAYLGKAEAEADADFSFMQTTKKKEYKDGEWTEKTVTTFVNAEASAGASVSVLAVDAEAGVGNDMLGVEVEAEGSAGNAKAEVKGEFSVGEDGVNANLQGELMVSAVEGEAKGTINILGIEITGKIGGHAGALGVGGKAGVENNKFVIEGEVAALLGVSAGVEIGFNEEGWNNFTEGVEKGWNDFTEGVEDFVDFATFWD